MLGALGVPPVWATIRYGDIQISGNLETQNLVRLHNQFEMQPVQQRNTFRLQYEHVLVSGGKIWKTEFQIPGIRSVDFFGYYRGVYDSIYHIAPGGYLRTQDGGRGTRISDIPSSQRSDIAFENNIREIYVDIKTRLPLSLRIGRQQIVWGNSLSPGVWDTNNTLDAGWHGNQELGLLGKVGFSETRNPFWAVKLLYDLGSVGPISNAFIEAYDVPFGFIPTNTPQQPAPWGVPFLSPFRPGLVGTMTLLIISGSCAAYQITASATFMRLVPDAEFAEQATICAKTETDATVRDEWLSALPTGVHA